MVTGIMGKKLGMTRIFTPDGRWIPVTVLEAGPCTVVQRKTTANDGYEAVQLGYGEIKDTRCTKPLKGHFAKVGVTPKRVLREFRVDPSDELKPGDSINATIFSVGEMIDITGTSKGKGFAGVHKRHHFGGGPGTHGSNFHRRPGSIGQSADPAEVYKGVGLPGHMGCERITAPNLRIYEIDINKNLILVQGSVPGANGGLVVVSKARKGAK